ncbi:MAG TPA: hypothetical protein VIY56_14685, partial [Vicinamibacterales bacterium]
MLAVLGGFLALFTWVYSKPLLSGTLLAESDLYEYYLPIFAAPITTWSSFEFSGLPAFADPGDFTAYPLHFFFARLVAPLTGSLPVAWTGLAISAFALAAAFTYAYVFHVTRSWPAAALAGVAYGLSEALMERLPHSGTLHAAVWLPLAVLSVERLREPRERRWIGIGGFALASCFLAGHPQPAIYISYCCALYAFVSGIVHRSDRGYWGRAAAMFGLGAFLTLVKYLPFIEASFHMARQSVNLTQFVNRANTPAQMLSLLFPSILHDGREAPTYVGLATLALAAVAMASVRQGRWRLRFWGAVVVFGVLIGMGSATPVAEVTYWVVPLYGKFRVVARHLILAAFGLSVLAGFGVAALRQGEASRRGLLSVAAGLILVLGVGTLLLLEVPTAFAYEGRTLPRLSLGPLSNGVLVQLALGALTAGCLVSAARWGRGAAWVWLTLALLVADDLYSLPYRVGAAGISPITMPAAAAAPSVHAVQLASEVSPGHQRLLAPSGTHRDAVVPAAWARMWRIPIAGGYGPMLLGRYAALGEIGTNGAIGPHGLAARDRALDLMAVRRIMIPAEDLAAPPTFERAGLTWSQPPLELTIGRADCDKAYPRQVSVALPAMTAVSEVALVGYLRCGEEIPTGAEAMTVRLLDGATVVHEARLAVGQDIADRSLADPTVLARARHRPTPIFADPDGTPNQYLVRVRLPLAAQADRVVFDVPPMRGWMTIERMTVVDGAGGMRPLALPGLWLGDAQRWTEVRRVRTSRETDRGHDTASPTEGEVVVFENRQAMPRAWVTSEIVGLQAGDLLEAVRHGQLRDGRTYDPRTMALVEGGTEVNRRFDTGPDRVDFQEIGDGRIAVRVSSGGGLLVLSETFYPGWRARLDGLPV